MRITCFVAPKAEVKIQKLSQSIEKFTRLRQELYGCYNVRQDTVMDLLDALSSVNYEKRTDSKSRKNTRNQK